MFSRVLGAKRLLQLGTLYTATGAFLPASRSARKLESAARYDVVVQLAFSMSTISFFSKKKPIGWPSNVKPGATNPDASNIGKKAFAIDSKSLPPLHQD
jgi:hypothetical protein